MGKLLEDKKYTPEEKEKLLKYGKYAGETLAGVGAVMGGLGLANSASSRATEEIKAHAKKGIKTGVAMVAAGSALAGFSKYTHYKDKKKKEVENEETKTFSGAAMMADARLKSAQISANSRREEQTARNQRAKMNDLRRAQRIQQLKTEAINRNLVQVSENAKDRVQNLNLFKTKSTIIKPKSMNKKAFNGYN